MNMNVRGALATLSLIVGAAGCAAPAGDDPPEEAPAADQPLDLTIDSLDVVHGALRVSATMVDGAADVSVRLGGECEHREVGGGLSTLSTLVWSLGDSEVAEATSCGLVVRARVREGTRYVNKVADLEVTVDMGAQAENPDDGPQLQAVAPSELGVSAVFSPVTRGARLTTGDSVLEAALPGAGDGDPAPGDVAGRFTIPRIDFARSVLRGRPLSLEGSLFATSLSVGGTSLQTEAPPSDEPEEEQEEPSPGEPPDEG